MLLQDAVAGGFHSITCYLGAQWAMALRIILEAIVFPFNLFFCAACLHATPRCSAFLESSKSCDGNLFNKDGVVWKRVLTCYPKMQCLVIFYRFTCYLGAQWVVFAFNLFFCAACLHATPRCSAFLESSKSCDAILFYKDGVLWKGVLTCYPKMQCLVIFHRFTCYLGAQWVRDRSSRYL